MADDDGELTVAQRLGRLLDRGLLPAGGPAEAAERLIERLERPARVALLGLPGSGKSAILNLLAGTVVVPETLRLPTIIVQHGNQPRMLCTLSDGRNEIILGDNLEKSLSLSPALITLELDLPALKVISLLEIAAGPLESDQRRAALWAGKRADILIWCTTSYLPKEQLVWEGMPDAFKDNGFLLLTKVDLLGGREAAAGMHHRVEQRAGGEFRQVLSISAKEARAATQASGQVDRGRFLESGAGSVISTIKTRVQSARRADTDTAELILARQAGPAEVSSRRPFEVAPPEPVVAKAPAPLAPPPATEKPPLSVFERPAPPPEPVFTPATETAAASEMKLVVAARTAPEVPEPVQPPATQVTAEPTALPDVTPQPVVVALDDPKDPAAAEPASAIDLSALPEPAVEGLAKAEVPTDSMPGPETAMPDDPVLAPDFESASDFDLAPEKSPQESPEPAVGFLTSAGGQRLSDRIKQIRPSGPTAEAPLVPLRATWKSRNDATPQAAAEMPVEPVKAPRPRPVDPASVGKPSFRVSAVKEAAVSKSDLPKPEIGPDASAEDRLKDLRRSDDIDEDLPLESVHEETADPVATPADAVLEHGDPVEVKEDAAEDPALARLSALRPPRPETPVLSQADEVEPEEEAAPEIPTEPLAEDPALARLSALRQPRTEAPVPVRRDPPVPEVETAPSVTPVKRDLAEAGPYSLREPRPVAVGRSQLDQKQSPAPAPAAAVASGALDDNRAKAPLPSEPLPDDAQSLDRDPEDSSATVEKASVRRPLSSRLSQTVGPTSGAPAVPASFPPPGPRMPRSGVPGSPRVTVLRERRVEDKPAEHHRIRIAPLSAPAAMIEPASISVGEIELLDRAIDMIVTRSGELLALIDLKEKLPVDLILEHGCETTEKVIAIVSMGNSAEMRRINGSLSELQDVIMLMQLEKGHAPADDTLTLLLQLRRELETLRSI